MLIHITVHMRLNCFEAKSFSHMISKHTAPLSTKLYQRRRIGREKRELQSIIDFHEWVMNERRKKLSNNTEDLSINSLKVFALLNHHAPKITAVSGKKTIVFKLSPPSLATVGGESSPHTSLTIQNLLPRMQI